MKKFPLLNTLAISIVAVLSWGTFLLPNAFANEIVSQTISTDSATCSNGSCIITQKLGTGFSSSFKTLQITAKETGGILPVNILITCFTSSSYATPCVGSDSGIVARHINFSINLTTKTVWNVDMNSIYNGSGYVTGYYTFDPSSYYVIQINNLSTAGTLYGSNADVYPNGALAVNTGTFGSMQDMFFDLYDNEAQPIGGAFINTSAPTNNQQFGSPYLITFSGAYAHTSGLDSFDSIGFSLVDVNTLQSFAIATGTISDSGNYSFSLTLPKDHAYQYYPFLFTNGSSSAPILQGSSVFFTTGSSTGLTGGITPYTSDFTSFFNVPQLLATRAPFAYFYLTAVTLQNLNTFSASSVPIGYVDINLPEGNAGSTTIRFTGFSTSTVAYFLTPTEITILRGLMVAVTYASVGLYLYRRGSNIISPKSA